MKELLDILNYNNIKYYLSNYAGYDSIIIKNNKYKMEIFKDDKGFVSDLQKIPYTWGVMGSTDLDNIIKDLINYLGFNIVGLQLNLF